MRTKALIARKGAVMDSRQQIAEIAKAVRKAIAEGRWIEAGGVIAEKSSLTLALGLCKESKARALVGSVLVKNGKDHVPTDDEIAAWEGRLLLLEDAIDAGDEEAVDRMREEALEELRASAKEMP